MAAPVSTDLPSRLFHGQDRLRGPLPPELLAPGYTAEIAGFPPMDAAGHAAFGTAFYSAFPDIGHTIEETVEAGPHVAVRFTLRGTHTAPFMGIPATGRPISVEAIAILTLEDGRVRHLRAVFDQLGLLRQLGVVSV